jgi:glycosyltransferase involved in cell wall biosynthesis
MGFASTYIESRVLFPELINEAPDKATGIIVVVPAYNEPGIIRLLDSLAKCIRPECEVEVIIVVNAPSDASDESISNNELSIKNIESWKLHNKECFFRLFSIIASPVIPGWGVGLARKTGMDEAVRRFNYLGRPEGVILNVDADCLVQENYLKAVYSELLTQKERSACSIYFEHPVSGSEFSDNIYKSIILYELHLRYYLQALAFTRFPDVYHTVGSAIAVKALPYVKAGGMNRKQAGEDFYFIQKLIPVGGYFSLNSTTVYPSPRESFRVPFGTGASMGKLSLADNPALFTYNLKAFNDLRLCFEMTDRLYSCKTDELSDCYCFLPEGVKTFITEREWVEKLIEVKENTSGYPSFKKRFFSWFNMFKVVKYLNFVHQEYYEKQPVAEAAFVLLDRIGVIFDSENSVDLLNQFRSMERTHYKS